MWKLITAPRRICSLTGLCSAIYLAHGPADGKVVQVKAPSPASGLYIQTRGGELTKVAIPPDCLAFQTGETLEIATAGRLRATPHCVRVGAGPGTENVSRETFALFMQPDTSQVISEKETFGSFSKKVFSEHYEGTGM
jgi:isopenicillin N synthase-like dioxygenase